MYTKFDQNLSDMHSNVPRITGRINGLKSKGIWASCALFTIAVLLISLIWTNKAQTHASNYAFIPTVSNILKTYIMFTEIQILIINKNQFD
jgi:hypothetical protein